MEVFFAPFEGKDLSAERTDTVVEMPLERFRWESEFGPDPEGKVLDPRSSYKLPGSPLYAPRVVTKDSPTKIALKQEAYEILKTLDFVVASENYVSEVLSGKRRGYITTSPVGKSHTLGCSIFDNGRGDFLIHGMLRGARDEQAVYFYKLALELWTLNGVCNLDGRDRDHEVFVSRLPVEEAKIAELVVSRAGEGREEGPCRTIGTLSEDETLSIGNPKSNCR